MKNQRRSKMKNRIFQSFLISSLILIASGLCAQEKFILNFACKAGQTFRYSTENSFDSQQEVNGQEMTTSGTVSSILKLFIDSLATNGDLTFISSYEKFKIAIKSAMMDTTMDQMQMVGKRSKVTFTSLGDLIKTEVLDSVSSMNKMGPGFTSGLTANFFLRFPGHPVAMGGKWNAETNDTIKIGDGNLITKGHFEYTLIQTELKNGHECYQIAFTSTTETTGKLKQMGMDFYIEGSGTTKGTGWIDQKSGMMIVKDSKSVQDMTYAMTGQVKMSIPMTQTIITSDHLIE